jgi:hypothetical protein
MELTEFILKFSPEGCNLPIERSPDVFEHFPQALERFSDMYYRRIVCNCDAETIDFHDLEQPDIEEL